MVDGVHVLHAVLDDLSYHLEPLPATHAGHSVALHQDVTVREHLDCLQGAPIGPDEPLPTLNVSLLVPNHPSNLYHVALHVVLQDLQRLGGGNRARQELNEVTRFDDDVRIERLSRGAHGHGTLHEVELARDAAFLQRAGHRGPHLPQVLLAVLGKQRGERRLFQETVGIVIFGERVNLPVVDAVVVLRVGGWRWVRTKIRRRCATSAAVGLTQGLSRRYRPFLPPAEASSPSPAATSSGALSSSAPILFHCALRSGSGTEKAGGQPPKKSAERKASSFYSSFW